MRSAAIAVGWVGGWRERRGLFVILVVCVLVLVPVQIFSQVRYIRVKNVAVARI